MVSRRRAIGAIAAGISGLSEGVQAQQYPTRPLRIISPNPPGGGVDNGARMVAEILRKALGQPVVVENKAGGNTSIGTLAVARSAPDGYTMLFTSDAYVVLPLITTKLPYDIAKDFVPVASLAYAPYLMLIHPSIPVNSVQQFIAYAQSKSGRLNYGSSGMGGGSHICGEVFKQMTGVSMTHIPYKGGGPALTDLMSGQIDATWTTVNAAAAQVKAGRVKALAVTSEARWPSLPDVPTFAEAGLPEFQEKAWLGLFMPAGTPRAVVDRVNGEISKFLRTPEAKATLEAQGLSPLLTSPEQFAETLRRQTTTVAPVVKAANIRIDIE